ncbi:uncharacterized protein LOC133383035 isoform X2 [Rhineura floridana]|uniref:uncharacterized protein LOC133383035 isoform X2 n=1 Tax=Rhineura floridana TaxID=261503 RepID=UPI002AC86533|nr:uncharacterized protein LOC133383035 isoform X2 [Rhineura floridana]
MGAGGGEELTSSKIIRSEFMEVTTLEKEAAGRALGINSASSGALWDLAASTLTTSIQSAPGAYTSLPEAAAVPVANDTSLIALPSLLPGETSATLTPASLIQHASQGSVDGPPPQSVYMGGVLVLAQPQLPWPSAAMAPWQSPTTGQLGTQALPLPVGIYPQGDASLPLGDHCLQTTKEKVWREEYIDIFTLLFHEAEVKPKETGDSKDKEAAKKKRVKP